MSTWVDIEEFGMEYDLQFAVHSVIELSDDEWKSYPLMNVSLDGIKGTERQIDADVVERLVESPDKIRSGYYPHIFITSKGDRIVVDGHHRVAVDLMRGKDSFLAYVIKESDTTYGKYHEMAKDYIRETLTEYVREGTVEGTRACAGARQARGLYVRGVPVRVKRVKEDLLDALNSDNLSRVRSILLEEAKDEKTDGLGTWWASEDQKRWVAEPYATEGGLTITDDGSYEFGNTTIVGVIFTARLGEVPGGGASRVSPDTEIEIEDIEVYVNDPPPFGYTTSETGSWMSIGGKGISTHARAGVRESAYAGERESFAKELDWQSVKYQNEDSFEAIHKGVRFVLSPIMDQWNLNILEPGDRVQIGLPWHHRIEDDLGSSEVKGHFKSLDEGMRYVEDVIIGRGIIDEMVERDLFPEGTIRYHLTLSRFISSIKSEGLEPRSQEGTGVSVFENITKADTILWDLKNEDWAQHEGEDIALLEIDVGGLLRSRVKNLKEDRVNQTIPPERVSVAIDNIPWVLTNSCFMAMSLSESEMWDWLRGDIELMRRTWQCLPEELDRELEKSGITASLGNRQAQEDRPENWMEIFQQTADQQRGAAESKMVEIQSALGGGVLGYCLEHVGDILHRMTARVKQPSDYSYGAVEEKAAKTLRELESGYGFEREMLEQLESNYKYNVERGYSGSFDDFLKEIQGLCEEYAELHSQLPVYNQPQYEAREAAIQLGKWNFKEAAYWLRLVSERTKDGFEFWLEQVTAWHPRAVGSKVESKENTINFGTLYDEGYADFATDGIPDEYWLLALIDNSLEDKAEYALGVAHANGGVLPDSPKWHIWDLPEDGIETAESLGLFDLDSMPSIGCVHGDKTCPCQDGDSCHYESAFDEEIGYTNPMRCPTTGIVGCTLCSRQATPNLEFDFGGDGDMQQYDGWIAAYVNNEKVGYLDWAIVLDEPEYLWIKMIWVERDFRGQDIAKAMLDKVIYEQFTQFGNPEPILWNDYLTDEGQKWWDEISKYYRTTIKQADQFYEDESGEIRWGEDSAAGILFVVRESEDGFPVGEFDSQAWRVLLLQRSRGVEEPGTWGIPGGAIQPSEQPMQAAQREAAEEAGITGGHVIGSHRADPAPDWSYYTFVVEIDNAVDPSLNWENDGYGWFYLYELDELDLHPGFEDSIDDLIDIIESDSKSSSKLASLNDDIEFEEFEPPWGLVPGEHRAEILLSGTKVGVVFWMKRRDGSVHIDWIQVYSKYQQQGIGLAVVEKLANLYDVDDVSFGMTTDLGLKLRRKWDEYKRSSKTAGNIRKFNDKPLSEYSHESLLSWAMNVWRSGFSETRQITEAADRILSGQMPDEDDVAGYMALALLRELENVPKQRYLLRVDHHLPEEGEVVERPLLSGATTGVEDFERLSDPFGISDPRYNYWELQNCPAIMFDDGVEGITGGRFKVISSVEKEEFRPKDDITRYLAKMSYEGPIAKVGSRSTLSDKCEELDHPNIQKHRLFPEYGSCVCEEALYDKPPSNTGTKVESRKVIAVSFEGEYWTEESKREVERGIDLVFSVFPNAPRINRVAEYPPEMTNSLAGKSNDSIYVNPEYWYDPAIWAEKERAAGYLFAGDGSPASIIVHEYMHILENNLSSDVSDEVWEFLREDVGGVPRHRQGLENPTPYGGESPYEFIAEGLTDYIYNDGNAHRNSIALAEFFHDAYGG